MASELRVDKIKPVDGIGTDTSTVKYGGGIIQVVHSIATNSVSQNSPSGGSTQTTLTDTGLTATITPKFSTSKVLVLVHQSMHIENGNDNVQFQVNMLLRDGSNNILRGSLQFDSLRWKNQYAAADVYSLNFLHSPNTTSPFTYKMSMNYHYISSGSGSLTAQFNDQANCQSEMTLMEVSA